MSLAQFAREYRLVRRAEGWGSRDPAYYQRLPYQDLSGRFSGIWRIRARSYDMFISSVFEPLEARTPRPLRILDLGAGSGWLAYRLAKRGHRVLAIDLLDDMFDGLGALRRYATEVQSVIAEFDHLPLVTSDTDLAVFNASLHYSVDFARTLAECLRVMRPRGTLVILDSPMYSDPSSGARMVQERQARFLARYGFASNALPSEHYLTAKRLESVGASLGLTWRLYRPPLHPRSQIERWLRGLRARREPAEFPVIVGTRT